MKRRASPLHEPTRKKRRVKPSKRYGVSWNGRTPKWAAEEEPDLDNDEAYEHQDEGESESLEGEWLEEEEEFTPAPGLSPGPLKSPGPLITYDRKSGALCNSMLVTDSDFDSPLTASKPATLPNSGVLFGSNHHPDAFEVERVRQPYSYNWRKSQSDASIHTRGSVRCITKEGFLTTVRAERSGSFYWRDAGDSGQYWTPGGNMNVKLEAPCDPDTMDQPFSGRTSLAMENFLGPNMGIDNFQSDPLGSNLNSNLLSMNDECMPMIKFSDDEDKVMVGLKSPIISSPAKDSKYPGVVWCPNAKKWCAEAQIAGRSTRLGYFENQEEAAQVVHETAQKIARGEKVTGVTEKVKQTGPDLSPVKMMTGSGQKDTNNATEQKSSAKQAASSGQQAASSGQQAESSGQQAAMKVRSEKSENKEGDNIEQAPKFGGNGDSEKNANVGNTDNKAADFQVDGGAGNKMGNSSV